METRDRKPTKRCVYCGRRVSVDAYECSYCGSIVQGLEPKYAPGKEPENVRGYLQGFFAELNEAYPDCNIDFDTWNHERWDAAAVALQKHLGYKSGSAFLKAYGYGIGKAVPAARPKNERTNSDSHQESSNVSRTAIKAAAAPSRGISKVLLSTIIVAAVAVVGVSGYGLFKNGTLSGVHSLSMFSDAKIIKGRSSGYVADDSGSNNGFGKESKTPEITDVWKRTREESYHYNAQYGNSHEVKTNYYTKTGAFVATVSDTNKNDIAILDSEGTLKYVMHNATDDSPDFDAYYYDNSGNCVVYRYKKNIEKTIINLDGLDTEHTTYIYKNVSLSNVLQVIDPDALRYQYGDDTGFPYNGTDYEKINYNKSQIDKRAARNLLAIQALESGDYQDISEETQKAINTKRLYQMIPYYATNDYIHIEYDENGNERIKYASYSITVGAGRLLGEESYRDGVLERVVYCESYIAADGGHIYDRYSADGKLEHRSISYLNDNSKTLKYLTYHVNDDGGLQLESVTDYEYTDDTVISVESDANGNLKEKVVKQVDENGNTIMYSYYDSNGILKSEGNYEYIHFVL